MSSIEESKKKLKDELEKLKYEYKIELPKKISHARSHGDLKENADYHAARERQSFVKAKIAQLSKQLSQLNEMNISEGCEEKVGFGTRITVIDRDTEDRIEFTFVSPNEVNPSQGMISLSSPIGMAFQNKQVGSEVEANIPAGRKRYFIEKLVTAGGKTLEA